MAGLAPCGMRTWVSVDGGGGGGGARPCVTVWSRQSKSRGFNCSSGEVDIVGECRCLEIKLLNKHGVVLVGVVILLRLEKQIMLPFIVEEQLHLSGGRQAFRALEGTWRPDFPACLRVHAIVGEAFAVQLRC